MERKPHAVVIPFPAQGHVIPLLEISYLLVDRGFQVTFINNEYTHNQITAALRQEEVSGNHDGIKMVAITDGMSAEDTHNIGLHFESKLVTMQGHFEEFLQKLNQGEDKVSWIVADHFMAWAVEVGRKVGVRRSVVVWTMAAELLAPSGRIPALIESGMMDENGFVAEHQMINLSNTMQPMNTKDFLWVRLPDQETSQTVFRYFHICCKAAKKANYKLCNSFFELEPAAFQLIPDLLPIGPLLPARQTGKPAGHFWAEDLSCLTWLDEQAARSVIYVAFGSHTLLDQRQFQELAFGLELTGKPFLWVVRPDLVDGSNGTYPEGFEARVAGRGKMVAWAPQQTVLAHPSIACFMSHCGWNSTMEGMTQGVPFLCWPYFSDQFSNAKHICNVWKTGLMLEPGTEDGIFTRGEVKNKAEALANDEIIAANANELKNLARWNVNEGTSRINLDRVIEEIYCN